MRRVTRLFSVRGNDRTRPRDQKWGTLAPPVFPVETQIIQRAQSILSGPPIGACPPLTLEQALDVLRWYRPRGSLVDVRV